MSNYVAPADNLAAFNCPHCNAYCQQDWFSLDATLATSTERIAFQNARLSQCLVCKEYAIWYRFTTKVLGPYPTGLIPQRTYQIIYPKSTLAPKAADDMPEDVKNIYNEARNIINDSSKGAAALLRLALQKLMPHLGEKGENINDDIGELVKKGLNPVIQEALDSLRVIGNNAVHPGQINLDEKPETANKLFTLINSIIELKITREKVIKDVYQELPESAKKAIEQRDSDND